MATFTCVVSGTCISIKDSNLENVEVSAHLLGSELIYDDGTTKNAIASGEYKTKTDSSGNWSMTLIKSKYIYQDGTSGVKYKIRLKGYGFDESKEVTIPDSDTVRYEDL